MEQLKAFLVYKAVWIEDSYRYRDPNEDTHEDFEENKVVGSNLFSEFGTRIGSTEGVLDNEAEEGNRLRQSIKSFKQ